MTLINCTILEVCPKNVKNIEALKAGKHKLQTAQGYSRSFSIKVATVEPRSTDNRLIWTHGCYGQFHLSRREAHLYIFSKISPLKRTPANTDNGHFSVSRETNSSTLSTPLYGYFRTVYYVLIVHFHYDVIRAKPDGSLSRPAETGPSVL